MKKSSKGDFENVPSPLSHWSKSLGETYVKSLREKQQNVSTRNLSAFQKNNKEESIEDRIRRAGLQDLKQNIWLKLIFFGFMILLLSVQTGLIFRFVHCQGYHEYGFKLDPYIFYILISGTIVQTCFLLRIAANHLFPPTHHNSN